MNKKTIIIFTILILAQQFLLGQTLSFDSPKVFDAGFNSNMLVSADFNNDGLMDIATTNYTGDNISILIAIRADSFLSEVLYNAGDGTFDIVVGDFNLDKNIDLAVSNYNTDNISVFIGKGDGTFYSKADYIADNGPKGIVTGLFNNDSFPDIAVANDLADNISVFIGTGSGTFSTKVNYTTGDRPHDLLVGLINQDANPDLISVNRSDDKISVLKGNGNGTFQSKVDFSVGHFPEYATLGNFNSDSLIDLAVCNSWNYDSVSILLGDTGTIFKTKKNFYAGYRPFGVTAADFNLDSKIDLALTIKDKDSINILLGNGNGSFQMPYKVVSGNEPHDIISLDIDFDSDIDLINVNYLSGGSTYLYLNSLCPKITFLKQNSTIVGLNNGWAKAIVTGGLRPYKYFWNDPANQKDSLAKNLYAGTYTLTIHDSLGCNVKEKIEIRDPLCTMSLKFSKIPVSVIGGADGKAIVTPINGTAPFSFLWNDIGTQTDSIASGLTFGHYQVIVTDSVGCIDSGEVIILELPCFNESRNYSGLGANDVEICYINSDSILDLVTLYSVAYSTDYVNILFGNGDGTYTYHSSFIVGTGGDQPVNLEVNDFNGDKINDIIVTVPDGVNGFSVYLGNGDSTFQTKTDYFTGSRPWDMVSHDFDYDGDNDLLICRDQAGDVRLMKNNGSGVFTYYSSKSVGTNSYPKEIESGYLNNDTLIDLIVVSNNLSRISVLLGDLTYNFLPPVYYSTSSNPIDATLGDFNNDSIIDIAVSSDSYDKICVLIGNGDGTFKTKEEYMAGDNPRGIDAYDLNGDNNTDLVVLNGDSSLSILLGNGTAKFDSVLKYQLGVIPITSAVSDIDKDGDLDLVITLSGKDSVAILKNCFLEKCVYLFVDSLKQVNLHKNNGYISISAIGKNPPFTYQWNDSLNQKTAFADSLFAGKYKLVVTDSLGCKDSITVIVGLAPCLKDTTYSIHSICSGDSILFGGFYRKSIGIFKDTLTNILGCDSVNILNLKIIQNSSKSLTIAKCYSYISPSGKKTYTSSGVYQDTIPNYSGCDSLITINLTVKKSTDSTISKTVCNTYTVPSGDETYTSSGIYQDTIPNYSGCDSLITINLTVKKSTDSTISKTVCNTYTVPSGDETYTSSGIYQDTIPNYFGCDSLITINLTVKKSTDSTISKTVCNTYTVPSGDETYTSSGIYQDTIPNYSGCDSLITIKLTVKKSTDSIISKTVCNTYTVPSGDETYTSSGIYQDTIPNYSGCDSLITINLTVKKSTDSTISKTVCNTYTVPSGDETYTSSGIYQDTIPNYSGCDSLITIKLTVKKSTFSTISKTVCNTYTVPSGKATYTTSGIYQDTIPNYSGCDSLITIKLTVKKSTFSTISKTVCNTYTVPSGKATFTSSGIYQDTIPNYSGCDSLITINLTVKKSTDSTISKTVCNTYTVPSGDETYTSSGIYQDTIQNYFGCDSLITINLTVNKSINSTISTTVCNTYTVPSGKATYTASGIYQDTIPNYFGCDSLITINLTVNKSTNSTISTTVCNTYTVPSGNETYTASGIYQDTIPNYSGCDSLITINLSVNKTTFSTISKTECNTYTVPSGNETYTASGIYRDTIPNYSGCDSLITINLTIIKVDISVIQSADTLKAIYGATGYQWLNCDQDYSKIQGATNHIFVADTIGNYAVEVTRYHCIDTSECYYILKTGVVENSFGKGFKVYPNPTYGSISVEMGDNYPKIDIKIVDYSGQIIQQKTFTNINYFELNIEGYKGMYLMLLNADNNKNAVIKILKK